MATRYKVMLYGDSLVLAGVTSSLQKYARLKIVSVDGSPERAERELAALSPDVVILDLGMMTRDFAFDLLRDHPDLMLIGLDPGGDRVVVLSGEQARALRTEELVRLIESSIDVPRKKGIQEQAG